jgi:hypothetical protein
LVDGRHVSDNQDLLGVDLAEVGNLLNGRGLQVTFASTSNLILLAY